VSDKFVVAHVDFDNPSDGSISFWVFNSGELSTTISNIVLTCRDCGADVPTVGLVDPVTIPSKVLTKITFEFTPLTEITGDTDFGNRTYDLTVISETGAKQHTIIRSN
jgi:hypothetical protein